MNVSVKRLGGGYGGKLHNAQHIACGAALAASVVKRYRYEVNITLTYVLTVAWTLLYQTDTVGESSKYSVCGFIRV